MADTVHAAQSLAGQITEMKCNPQTSVEEIDLAAGHLPVVQYLYPSSRTTPSSHHYRLLNRSPQACIACVGKNGTSQMVLVNMRPRTRQHYFICVIVIAAWTPLARPNDGISRCSVDPGSVHNWPRPFKWCCYVVMHVHSEDHGDNSCDNRLIHRTRVTHLPVLAPQFTSQAAHYHFITATRPFVHVHGPSICMHSYILRELWPLWRSSRPTDAGLWRLCRATREWMGDAHKQLLLLLFDKVYLLLWHYGWSS